MIFTFPTGYMIYSWGCSLGLHPLLGQQGCVGLHPTFSSPRVSRSAVLQGYHSHPRGLGSLGDQPPQIFFLTWKLHERSDLMEAHTRVSTGRDVPLSLCPRTKNFLVPVSFCPGTRAGANIPGQTPLSQDVPGQNELKFFKKRPDFLFLDIIFLF